MHGDLLKDVYEEAAAVHSARMDTTCRLSENKAPGRILNKTHSVATLAPH